jgi:F0F1-type ATP synthase assembly protein I
VRNTIGPISLILTLGTLVVVATLLPLVVGLWLDAQLHTTPWITLVASVVGVMSAIASVYRVISEQYKKSG